MHRFVRWFPVVIAASAAAIAFSCSSSDSSEPAGAGGSAGAAGAGGSAGTAGSDAGCGTPPTAVVEHCSGPLPVMAVYKDDGSGTKKPVKPDWSCMGASADAGAEAGADAGDPDAGDPDAGAAGGEALFELRGFSSDDPMGGVQVEVFSNNAILGGGGASFTATTAGPLGDTDAGTTVGQFRFPVPGERTPMAYRALAKQDVTKTLVEFDVESPLPGDKFTGNGISPSVFDTLAISAVKIPLWTPPADLGIVAVAVRDCADDDVEGALVDLVDDATQQPLSACNGARDLRYVYFDTSSLPNANCTYTNHEEPLVVMINAPANGDGPAVGHGYTIRFRGRIDDTDTEPRVFATRPAEVYSGAINVYHLRPR